MAESGKKPRQARTGKGKKPVDVPPESPIQGKRQKVGLMIPSRQLAPPPVRRTKPGQLDKDACRWKDDDDYSLIMNMQQTNDLTEVFLGVKFSCRFTLREIQERWYQLLYDPVLSKAAQASMQQMPVEKLLDVESGVLFSRKELDALEKLPSSTPATDLQPFEDLLQNHSSDFHHSRSADILQQQWILMRHHQLLADQTGSPLEALYSESESDSDEDDSSSKIAQTEREAVVLIQNVTGISREEFHSNTHAVLQGRLVRFLICCRQITLGRDNSADIDLSMEGPAWQISRRQALIQLRQNGEFALFNVGRIPVLVDGRVAPRGNAVALQHNTVIEMGVLKLTFIVNFAGRMAASEALG